MEGVKKKLCQMTMSDSGRSPTGSENYWACGRKAVAWVPDQFKRTGWNGRQYLCKLHVRFYNKKAVKLNRPLAVQLE